MAMGKNAGGAVRFGLMAVLLVSVAACDENGLNFGQSKDGASSTTSTSGSIKLVERDVESPEAFEVNTEALWDGRPSLGGVWVAHPDSKQPERVIIRNESNGKFVIGALFRRERNNPGPKLQLSSDAADALGVLAGTPTKLRVTALRRETVNEAEEEPAETAAVSEDTTAGEVATSEIGEPASTEEISSAVLASVAAAETETPTPAPTATAPASSALSKPYVQIGFFSVESNAKANVKKMTSSGIPAKSVKSEAKGKTFWRVLAGPAKSKAEKKQLLENVKKQGFTDAYFVGG